MTQSRTETDSFGPLEVPADKYWGAQTQRSLGNFKIGGETMPEPMIRALGIVKMAAAKANMSLDNLEGDIGQAVVSAATEVAGEEAPTAAAEGRGRRISSGEGSGSGEMARPRDSSHSRASAVALRSRPPPIREESAAGRGDE